MLPLRRRLMERRGFVPDYTALDASGASWLVAHRPSVQLVGIDYLTVATYANLVAPHEVLLGQVRGKPDPSARSWWASILNPTRLSGLAGPGARDLP